MRQYALIELTEEFRNAMKDDKEHPIMKEKAFIFFGEIPNMPGHCVIAGHKSGRIFSGYHLDNFQEVEEEGYWIIEINKKWAQPENFANA